MAGDPLVKRHTFCFNDDDNGGESLILCTEMYANGDLDGIYYNQNLTLQSYGNSATFNLIGASFTPGLLRKLADELEAAEREAKQKTPGHIRIGISHRGVGK